MRDVRQVEADDLECVMPLLLALVKHGAPPSRFSNFEDGDFSGDGDGLAAYRRIAAGVEAGLCVLQVRCTRCCRCEL